MDERRHRPFPGDDWSLTAHYVATGEMIIDPKFIYKKWALKDAREAFQDFKTPGKVKGRVMLVN